MGPFLTGRSQQVKIGSALSNSVISRGGIPQGTRLAPLLHDHSPYLYRQKT